MLEEKDLITASAALLSSAIVVSGWIFTRFKDREQERFRATIARRESLAKAFLVVDSMLIRTSGKIESEPDFVKCWIDLANLMQLYGSRDENESLEEFTNAFFGSNRSVTAANVARNKLKNTLTSSIRAELRLDALGRTLDIPV